MVKTSAETNAAVAAMVRNTRSGRAMTASDRTTQGWRDQSRAVMAGDCTSECFGPGGGEGLDGGHEVGGGRHGGDLGGDAMPRRRGAPSVVEEVADGSVDVGLAAAVGGEHCATTGGDDGEPVLPLVGEERDDELRSPVGRRAEHGAGAAVRDHPATRGSNQPAARSARRACWRRSDRAPPDRRAGRAWRRRRPAAARGRRRRRPTGRWWTVARSRRTRRWPAGRRAPRPTPAGHHPVPARRVAPSAWRRSRGPVRTRAGTGGRRGRRRGRTRLAHRSLRRPTAV